MELQLLIAELKDREQELNSMASAHHRQLQAWEQDRQRVLTLEQRSARLEGRAARWTFLFIVSTRVSWVCKAYFIDNAQDI